MRKSLVICLTILFSLLSLTKFVSACEQSKSITNTLSCCDHQENTTEHTCCLSQDSPKHEHNDHCDGKCKGAGCQQNSPKFQLFIVAQKNYECPFFFDKKEGFYDKDNQLSSGFSSIWLPPKIG
ncbi:MULTISPECIES: hypothetical protein [Sphingobacterium]|uniref:hypothetical protein n=1 Tax=Sphingobacterium TaxID=28453 RepID=UPI0013DACD49|nr:MULTISPECIES: hypothetical protein [unclassified Sphingobacterium]